MVFEKKLNTVKQMQKESRIVHCCNSVCMFHTPLWTSWKGESVKIYFVGRVRVCVCVCVSGVGSWSVYRSLEDQVTAIFLPLTS